MVARNLISDEAFKAAVLAESMNEVPRRVDEG
jgi:hypothetical protein